MDDNTIKISLDRTIFAGFYECIWWTVDDEIYDCLEKGKYKSNEDGDFRDDFYNAIDYKKYNQDIAVAIVELLSYKTGIPLTFDSLNSPRFYNYSTDTIDVLFTMESLQKRVSELSESETKDYLKHLMTVSREYTNNRISYHDDDDENILKADIEFTALCLTLYSEDIHEDQQQSIDIGGIMHSLIRFEELKKYAPKE